MSAEQLLIEARSLLREVTESQPIDIAMRRHIFNHLEKPLPTTPPAGQGAEDGRIPLGAVRFAWEAGFKLCRSYGDNWFHCDGEQRERHWKRFLESQGYTHFFRSAQSAPNEGRK